MGCEKTYLSKIRRMYKVLRGDVRLIAVACAAGEICQKSDNRAVIANEALELTVRLMYLEQEEDPDKFYGVLSTPEGTRELADRTTAEWKKRIIADHFGEEDVVHKAASIGISLSAAGDTDRLPVRVDALVVFPNDCPVMLSFSTDGSFEDYRSCQWMRDPDTYV
jgi:hypothetical protein